MTSRSCNVRISQIACLITNVISGTRVGRVSVKRETKCKKKTKTRNETNRKKRNETNRNKRDQTKLKFNITKKKK